MFERLGGLLDDFLAVAMLLLLALPAIAVGMVLVFLRQIYYKILK